MSKDIRFLMFQLRQTVAVAKEAKVMGWPDLEDYSIRSAERLIAEIESLMIGGPSEQGEDT